MSTTTTTVAPKKWEGEDRDGGSPASDWEESSDEETGPVHVAAPRSQKKKGTLKQKLAEKEAEKAQRILDNGSDYNSDDVLDPREKAKLDREREMEADLSNAMDLMGSSRADVPTKTKEDFELLSDTIMDKIIKPHSSKPMYPSFVEHHVRQLAGPLRDIEIKKVASALTALANEKQREQRDTKKKKPAKPALGGAKASTKYDTNIYDESLDDDDSFM